MSGSIRLTGQMGVGLTGGGLRYPGVYAALDFAGNHYELASRSYASLANVPGFSFTRASTAWGFGSNGYLQSFASGVARLVYDPVTFASLGILVEEARTNVCLWNRDLTNAAWVATNVTPLKDQTGIDGVANSASKITATAGNGTILQAITLASSARQQSTYIKRITGSGVIEMTTDNGTTWTAVTVTASWTPVTIPVQTLANPTVGFRIVTSGDAVAIDCVGNEGGTGASSAIPTTSAAVTRAADVPYNSGLATLPEFTVVAEGIPNSPDTMPAVQTIAGYDDGTATNRAYAFRSTNSAANLATSTGYAYNGANWPQGASRKVAFTSRAGAQTGAFNGTLAIPGTSAQPANLSSLSIGIRSDRATLQWNGTIARIRVYNRALSNAQLQALTA